MRKIFIIPVLTFLIAVGVGGTVSAGKPTIERFTVNETFQEPFLNAACGVDISITSVGHVIVRTFDDDGTGPVEVRTLNTGVTFTAGDNTFRLRDVGADLVRIEPDGTAILMIVGQIPFEFNGVLKLDLETGEVIHEPQFTDDAVAEACAILTA